MDFGDLEARVDGRLHRHEIAIAPEALDERPEVRKGQRYSASALGP
jgi:hypothetical protein